jgi:hypothetical protein
MIPARRRLASLALVAAGMTLLHAVEPDPARREVALGLVALPLGYGHLLGAWWSGRGRRPRRDGIERALAAVSVATALCAYTWALQVEGLQLAVLLPMLGVSGWHIAENDLALARTRDARLPALPRRAPPHAAALGATLLLGLAALATPEGAAWLALRGLAAPPFQPLALPDLLTTVLMYHAVVFVLLGLERARRLPPATARGLRRRLLAAHALPLGTSAALFLALPALHAVLAAPALYLFFSVLHALHTAHWRGVDPEKTGGPLSPRRRAAPA